MIQQLNPPIPVNTPKGNGEAWLVIDYHPETDIMWVVCLDDTGQVWTFKNQEVRGIKNVTIGRNNPEVL